MGVVDGCGARALYGRLAPQLPQKGVELVAPHEHVQALGSGLLAPQLPQNLPVLLAPQEHAAWPRGPTRSRPRQPIAIRTCGRSESDWPLGAIPVTSLGRRLRGTPAERLFGTEGDAPSRSNELRCNAGDIKGAWRRASPNGSRRRPAGEPANIRLRRRASV